jgi:peptidoglycan hydrolase-like protein with peptidoglycan-binding domain
VRSLQSLLNTKAGQGLVIDGAFGPRTDRAVRNVQAFLGLAVDGIVGRNTWGVLFL